MLNIFGPEKDVLQDTTVWNFPDRGSWATHNPGYRGNWSPYVPRNIIKRYSQPQELVLDAFVGSGTTLVEAKLLERNAIGIDINPYAVQLTKQNIEFNCDKKSRIEVMCADAKNLYFIQNNSIDLICTHPPYANIIQYSKDIKEDLSLGNMKMFLENLEQVAQEMYRILKPQKYCAFMMGDIRKKGNIIPLGFECMKIFEKNGFILKEIVIKEQHNCKSTSKWIDNAKKYNFLLLAHEYLFVLKK